MLDRLFSNDSIHTLGAYEIDRQVRARQRQRYQPGSADEVETLVQVKHSDKPQKGLLVGLFSSMGMFLGF
jgi:hypothetical protein